MWKENINNVAFSLLEVLLAAIIFVISVAGVFVTLNAVRRPVINKENALKATIFGNQVLESLYSQVSAETWNNQCAVANGICPEFSLYLGNHQVPEANLPPGLSWPDNSLKAANTACGNGCLVYRVSCGDETCTDPNASRRVDLNINWPMV
jgi:Tfp pilus assembly protein PilV